MSFQGALDDIATGEATLETGAALISEALGRLDEDVVDDLFNAMRSWVWKTLESRRRDEELVDWIDMFGRVAAHIEDEWRTLAVKLEAYVELLQASVMVASANRAADPLKRKHVRTILSLVYRAGGKLRRQQLLEGAGLKDANLSNIIAPLRDRGWLQREIDGREAIYRLTEKGKEVTLSLVAHSPSLVAYEERLIIGIGRKSVPSIKTLDWGELHDEFETHEPASYLAIVDPAKIRGYHLAGTPFDSDERERVDATAVADYLGRVRVKEASQMELSA